MTDEEKKAIDVIRSLGISIYNGKSQIIPGVLTKEISSAIYTTINLIEKQSKEIEEYKECERLSKRQLEKQKNDIESLEIEIEELTEKKAIYYYEWKYLEANVINKIQEYDDKGMTVNLANKSAGKTFQQAVHYEVKKVLQSLLEKE